ncbi:MAG: 5-oxoprolinase/urea amidolyase family protein, partial [Ilumatobacteraceae bacterium]
MSPAVDAGLLLPSAGRAVTCAVVEPGPMTTVQDLPGRVGYWHVGVPPSGPMDDLAQRLANLVVGNPDGAAALELTGRGPTLRFDGPAVLAIGGAAMAITVDDVPADAWSPIEVATGSTVTIGAVAGPGLRACLAVRGGFAAAPYLGSRSTFTLGNFGGHDGRALRSGDVLGIDEVAPGAPAPRPLAAGLAPVLTTSWELGVLVGPHSAPDFLTPAGLDALLRTSWVVHFNSARTGVRLIGPRPLWARDDGGEAGLHPSNIHDTGYAIGAVDITGDMPVILGPDGPSLGGFVCPAVVAAAERWKLGQLAPGDRVKLVPWTGAEAAAADDRRGRWLARATSTIEPVARPSWNARTGSRSVTDDGVLARRPPDEDHPGVTYRRAGDRFVLVEYGPMTLDLGLRLRVELLDRWVATHLRAGIVDVTPGVRSLLVQVDGDVVTVEGAARRLQDAEAELVDVEHAALPSRIVHLPLSWDDPSTREAIDRYMKGVRADAPWCPWNIEFIRRINGLAGVDDVQRIVFDASYLVLGLGDVYLGAPVATPLDPRHRLVTTKYNPARTWTPENAVGIGGAYLCIYGMEGPGGYQFVGRTVQVWNRDRRGAHFDQPWLLRSFDQLRFHPVSADELLAQREEQRESIDAFRQKQRGAFDAERERWRAAGVAETPIAESIRAEAP